MHLPALLPKRRSISLQREKENKMNAVRRGYAQDALHILQFMHFRAEIGLKKNYLYAILSRFVFVAIIY